MFAHRGENDLRADIVLYRLEAKENFGHAYTNVCLQALGDTQGVAPVVFTPLYLNGRSLTPDENLLHAGEVWEGAFALVHKGELAAETFTKDYAQDALLQARAYWQVLKPFHHTIQIPDTQIQDMMDACARNIMQARGNCAGAVRVPGRPHHVPQPVDGGRLLSVRGRLHDGAG